MPAALIKRGQGFAETFQKVTQPRENAGCPRLALPFSWRRDEGPENCEDPKNTSTDLEGSMNSHGERAIQPEQMTIVK